MTDLKLATPRMVADHFETLLFAEYRDRDPESVWEIMALLREACSLAAKEVEERDDR